MNEEDEILDTDWIAKFENIDKSYNIFYLDDVKFIKVKCVYINTDNEIEKIKQENFVLGNPNYLSREEVMGLIKHNSYNKYRLLSILKYNINLDPIHIKSFVMKDYYEESFLTNIKSIDAITWDTTISMFQDLNEIIFFFYEKASLESHNNNNTTRRVLLQKRIMNKGKVKKTIRMQSK